MIDMHLDSEVNGKFSRMSYSQIWVPTIDSPV